MATVTGTLLDIGLQSLADRSPELQWVPSHPSVTIDGDLISGIPILTTPAANGDWSVELVSSEVTTPPITYSLRIRLLDPSGGFVWIDFPEWDLFVPEEGGSLPTIAHAPSAGGVVWTVDGDDIPPLARSGDLLFNTLTSDLYRIG